MWDKCDSFFIFFLNDLKWREGGGRQIKINSYFAPLQNPKSFQSSIKGPPATKLAVFSIILFLNHVARIIMGNTKPKLAKRTMITRRVLLEAIIVLSTQNPTNEGWKDALL